MERVKGRGKLGRIAVLALLLFLLGAASIARAELSASGNLFITFNGGIVPNALPRHDRAPITVWIAGKVRTLAGEQPPALRTITIALNRSGRLETKGLPTCRRGRIEATTSAEALKVCGDALVGSGTYRARSTFPEQARSPTFGKILAFNATTNGHPAILAHVHGTKPAPSTNIIPFQIRRTKGRYGTVLTGSSPIGLTRWGYLKQITLRLHRNYVYRGRRHSYLSAPCRAPEDLSQATFPFAYTSMSFVDGRILSATLSRTCRVRRGT
ncbi:MAG TPA: hypothetical protein VGF04_04160 [Solirubrobacterales bacterium]